MRFTIAFAAAAAGSLAVAQTTTTASAAAPSSDICAMDIVKNCVSRYQTRIDKCNEKSNDWLCLCDEYTNLLTCYNNCPSSQDKPPVQNQVTQYCNAAAPLKASQSSVAATAVKTSAAPTSASATSSAGTSIPSSQVQPERNDGQSLGVSVGGVFAFALGVANML